MDLLVILVIAFTLAMDAFAASISCGITAPARRSYLALKVGTVFGSFQLILFIIGWISGAFFRDLVSFGGTWIAFVLLVIIGGRMIMEAVRNWKTGKECKPLRRRELMLLGVATSIDAFIVGISLGVLGSELLIPALMIGGVTFLLSFVGVEIGDRMKNHLDRWAEIIAGFILIIIAVRTVTGDLI